MENSFTKRLNEIKSRDTKIIEGTRLKEDFGWLIEQAELNEQIKGAYEDRVDDIDSLEKIITGIKKAYESKDENTLDEHLHDLFTNQLVEDY